MNASQTPQDSSKPFVFNSPEGYALCRRILKEHIQYEPHDTPEQLKYPYMVLLLNTRESSPLRGHLWSETMSARYVQVYKHSSLPETSAPYYRVPACDGFHRLWCSRVGKQNTRNRTDPNRRHVLPRIYSVVSGPSSSVFVPSFLLRGG